MVHGCLRPHARLAGPRGQPPLHWPTPCRAPGGEPLAGGRLDQLGGLGQPGRASGVPTGCLLRAWSGAAVPSGAVRVGVWGVGLKLRRSVWRRPLVPAGEHPTARKRVPGGAVVGGRVWLDSLRGRVRARLLLPGRQYFRDGARVRRRNRVLPTVVAAADQRYRGPLRDGWQFPNAKWARALPKLRAVASGRRAPCALVPVYHHASGGTTCVVRRQRGREGIQARRERPGCRTMIGSASLPIKRGYFKFGT